MRKKTNEVSRQERNKLPNKVDKNAVAVTRTNSQCKEKVLGHMQHKH